MVESQPSKLLVAGSIPVSRSSLRSRGELRLSAMAEMGPGGLSATGGMANGGPSAVADGRRRREPTYCLADVAQLAERVLGKDEVTSSILVIGSRFATAARKRMLISEDRRHG